MSPGVYTTKQLVTIFRCTWNPQQITLTRTEVCTKFSGWFSYIPPITQWIYIYQTVMKLGSCLIFSWFLMFIYASSTVILNYFNWKCVQNNAKLLNICD